jgi:plasmid stabilization system protein ParE
LTVRFSLRARSDLRTAVEYLAERNPAAAVALTEQLLETIERLAGGEFEEPPVQLRSGSVVRSWPVAPYRIYYQRTGQEFRVVRVYHQARRPIAKK